MEKKRFAGERLSLSLPLPTLVFLLIVYNAVRQDGGNLSTTLSTLTRTSAARRI